MSDDPDAVLTAREAAAFMKIHYRTLLELHRSGEIPARRVRNRLRFLRHNLVAYLDKHPTTLAD